MQDRDVEVVVIVAHAKVPHTLAPFTGREYCTVHQASCRIGHNFTGDIASDINNTQRNPQVTTPRR